MSDETILLLRAILMQLRALGESSGLQAWQTFTDLANLYEKKALEKASAQPLPEPPQQRQDAKKTAQHRHGRPR